MFVSLNTNSTLFKSKSGICQFALIELSNLYKMSQLVLKIWNFEMKFVVLLTVICFLGACSESTNISLPVKKDEKGNIIKVPKITWGQYHKYCGAQNIRAKENFKSVKGVVVTWKGEVYAIREDAGVKDSRSHAPKIIQVKMAGTGSLLTDVTLRLPKGSEKIYGNMKKGDTVIFRGKVGYLGSKLNDHIILVDKFKKEAKKKK